MPRSGRKKHTGLLQNRFCLTRVGSNFSPERLLRVKQDYRGRMERYFRAIRHVVRYRFGLAPSSTACPPHFTAAETAALVWKPLEASIYPNESTLPISRPLDAVAHRYRHHSETQPLSRRRRERDKDVRRSRPAEPNARLGGAPARSQKMRDQGRHEPQGLRGARHGGLRPLHGHAARVHGTL